MGFYAALDDELTKSGPIYVYTFSAPPVGDKNFKATVKHLEETGKIRVARMHNKADPVPSLFELMRFKHVGLGIELDFPGFDISDQGTSTLSNLFSVLKSPELANERHTLGVTFDILNRHAPAFDLTLDEIYEKELGLKKP